MSSRGEARDDQPWFRRSPRISLVVSIVLYAAIFALRLTSDDASEATTMFYVLPIALIAVTFGLLGGLAGGVLAVALVVVWAVSDDVVLSAVGWATRAVPLLLLGTLLGAATDRLRRSEAERARLEAAARWHRQAVEINDSIVQGLAAAKWSLEGGDLTRASATVTEALDHAHAVVSQLLRDAGLQPGARYGPGDLATVSDAVGRDRSSGPEQRRRVLRL